MPSNISAMPVIGIGTVAGGFYTVQPTEMAGVRRLGTVVTKEPVGPGLHFKLPWIDTVDTIQTSLVTFQMNNLKVYTVDNQAVSVGVGLSYHIPPAAVMHLLYGVCRSGNIDIDGQLPGTMLGGTSAPLAMFNIQPTRATPESSSGQGQQARLEQR